MYVISEELVKTKFKIGDSVECIDYGTKGAGWLLGWKFKVTNITTGLNKGNVYWAGWNQSGVYEDSLRLASLDWDE